MLHLTIIVSLPLIAVLRLTNIKYNKTGIGWLTRLEIEFTLFCTYARLPFFADFSTLLRDIVRSINQLSSACCNQIFAQFLQENLHNSPVNEEIFCRRGSTKFVTKPTHPKSVYMHPNSAQIKIHSNPTMATSLFWPSKIQGGHQIQDGRHF